MVRYRVFNIMHPNITLFWIPGKEIISAGHDAAWVHNIFEMLMTIEGPFRLVTWALTGAREFKALQIILDKYNIIIGDETYTWEIDNG